MKLLIVDDEYLARFALKNIVEKNIFEITEIESATNGREAIDKVESFKPDICLIDIKMPGINGLETIKLLKERNLELHFIIVSAYEYFEYAQEAIQLDIEDYLLKPVAKDKLIDTINQTIVKINKRRASFHEELKLKEQLRTILPFLEAQVLHSLLLSNQEIELHNYHDLFEFSLESGYILIAKYDLGRDNPNIYQANIEIKRFIDNFHYQIKRLTKCLIGPALIAQIYAFIPQKENDSTQVKKFLSKLSERLGDKKVKLGAGRVYTSENLNLSYQEALIALEADTQANYVIYQDTIKDSSSISDYHEEEQVFCKLITQGKIQQAITSFSAIFHLISLAHKKNILKIKSKLLLLIGHVTRFLPTNISRLEKYINEEERLIQKIMASENSEELKISFINFLKNVDVLYLQDLKGEENEVIREAIKFIDGSYAEEISLEEVAKRLNISYHYLSKLFKETTGKNFSDYLTELRIEKSKMLLIKQKLSVKEISYLVGYNDANYFTKIFKKITGYTPSDYRNIITEKDDEDES